ncbi:MAG: hypothetical protein J6Y90_06180 [Lachnospiraceae bacterium]|nr:hypothetical protein [Lachnospiraceae bacterium]
MNETDNSLNNNKVAIAGLIAFILVSAVNIYYHTKIQVSSDTVTMLPVARDFLSGNYLLEHWKLGTNNFFFTETIFYVIGMALGLSDKLMIGTITPIFVSAFVVLFAWFFIIKDNGAGEGYRLYPPSLLPRTRYFLSICYVLVAGIVPWPIAYTMLNANSHNNLYFFIGLCFAMLIAWMRTGRHRFLVLYVPIAILLVFSEGFATMTLVGPALVFGLWFAFFDAKRRREGWYVAAVNAIVWLAAECITGTVLAANGLVTFGLPMKLVLSPLNVAYRVKAYILESKLFFDTGKADFTGIIFPDYAYEIVIWFTLAVFVLGLVMALFNFAKLSDVDRLLFITVFLNLCGCFFFKVDIHVRYIVPTWIFGAIVSLKQIALLFEWIAEKNVFWRVIVWTLTILMGLSVVTTTAKKFVVIQLNTPYGWKEKEVADYLEENGYGDGYGLFWSSWNISYFSDYEVDLKAIVVDNEGVYKYYELIRDDWYNWDDREYLVMNADVREKLEPHVYEYIGEPAEVTQINDYIIYRWKDDFTDELEDYDVNQKREQAELMEEMQLPAIATSDGA